MIDLASSRIVDASPRQIIRLYLDTEEHEGLSDMLLAIHGQPPTLFGGDLEVDQQIGALRLPRQQLRVVVERWSSVRFEQTGHRLARRLLWWTKTLDVQEVEEVDEGSLVRLRYSIGVRVPGGRLVERLLRRPLRRSLEEEMYRLVCRFNDTVVEIDPGR